MSDLTDAQRKKVRTLVESFRDAALKKIEAAEQCRGGGPSREDVDAFVRYDTWLKLDKPSKAEKEAADDARRKRNGEYPYNSW